MSSGCFREHMGHAALCDNTMGMITKSWITPHLFRMQLIGKRVCVRASSRLEARGLMPKIRQMVIMKLSKNEVVLVRAWSEHQ